MQTSASWTTHTHTWRSGCCSFRSQTTCVCCDKSNDISVDLPLFALQTLPLWTRRTRTWRSGCCAMTRPACRPPCDTWCDTPAAPPVHMPSLWPALLVYESDSALGVGRPQTARIALCAGHLSMLTTPAPAVRNSATRSKEKSPRAPWKFSPLGAVESTAVHQQTDTGHLQVEVTPKKNVLRRSTTSSICLARSGRWMSFGRWRLSIAKRLHRD